jgi:hypothetical protein
LEEPQSSRTGRRRTRISDENLHISAFALIWDGKGSILLVEAGNDHPLSFRRGKLLLPASMLQFGEWPLAAAKRAVATQLEGGEGLEPKFREIQSYLGSHWDLCFVYDFDGKGAKLKAKPPFVKASFHSLSALPRTSIATDHLEVIDGLSTAKQA